MATSYITEELTNIELSVQQERRIVQNVINQINKGTLSPTDAIGMAMGHVAWCSTTITGLKAMTTEYATDISQAELAWCNRLARELIGLQSQFQEVVLGKKR